MNKEPKFYNANGELTMYGLSCGYYEIKATTSKWKELYFSDNTFHVRSGVNGGK